MTILGFDTATAATTVALRLDDGHVCELRDDPSPGAHPGHATRLLPMADALLDGAGMDWRGLDRIAVGVGPGTFTGLRVGIATARGLAQSLAVELVGVSSALALAHAALDKRDAADGAVGGGADGAPPDAVLAVIDARRGEVFAAAYAAGAGGGAPVELMAPCALAPSEVGAAVAARTGSDIEPGWLAVGDGAVRYRERLVTIPVAVAADGSPLHLLRAASVCALASAEPAGSAGAPILPDYRRRPDAEIALDAAAATAASSNE